MDVLIVGFTSRTWRQGLRLRNRIRFDPRLGLTNISNEAVYCGILLTVGGRWSVEGSLYKYDLQRMAL